MTWCAGITFLILSAYVPWQSVLPNALAADADAAPSTSITRQNSNLKITGHGTRGSLFCTDTPELGQQFGTGIGFAIIDFSGTQQGRGELSGIWRIVIDPSAQVPGPWKVQ